MARTKKIDENLNIKERIKSIEEDEKESNSNDLFTPENMVKMFAIFKQMQEMDKQQNIKEKSETITKEIEKTDKKIKFTKAMLAKISDEEVVAKSTVDNLTFISPRTKIEYSWLSKGDIETLPISEILAMENKSKRFLHTPWLVIEDERVIEALSLQRTYDLIKKVENIDELILLSKDEIEKIFNELPQQYQYNFRNEIYKKVKTRELNNLSTIDVLSEVLHIDLKNI
jgi:hypothetical protein